MNFAFGFVEFFGKLYCRLVRASVTYICRWRLHILETPHFLSVAVCNFVPYAQQPDFHLWMIENSEILWNVNNILLERFKAHSSLPANVKILFLPYRLIGFTIVRTLFRVYCSCGSRNSMKLRTNFSNDHCWRAPDSQTHSGSNSFHLQVIYFESWPKIALASAPIMKNLDLRQMSVPFGCILFCSLALHSRSFFLILSSRAAWTYMDNEIFNILTCASWVFYIFFQPVQKTTNTVSLTLVL